MRKIDRGAAASGLLVILFGIAGASFERGSPPAHAPIDQVIAFWFTYRRELLWQSLMFVISSGAYLWFFSVLRDRLARVEGGTASMSMLAFGAGIVNVVLQLLLQALQVAGATASSSPLDHGVVAVLSGTTWAVSVIAYVPVAIMLAAVTAVAFHHRVLPAWLTWLTAITAFAHVIMTTGLVAESGALVPGGALTYILYALLLVWQIATTIVMAVRPLMAANGRPQDSWRTETQTP